MIGKNVYIMVRHDQGIMDPSFLNLLTAAHHFHAPIVAVVMGTRCEELVNAVSMLAGVDRVLYFEHAVHQHGFPESSVEIIYPHLVDAQAVLMVADTWGKDWLPRLAAKMDVGQVSNVIEILSTDTFVHPIYAGHILETVQVHDPIKMCTIRAIAFEPMTMTQAPCSIQVVREGWERSSHKDWVSQTSRSSHRPVLTQAKRVVSGGRALKTKENFQLIDDLADALGAAVGASRAAVDANLISNDHQVGQTGQMVAPELYVAVGISGAIQHVAGMKDSKIVVAINQDRDAPIFQIADYGLVGDLFEWVPAWIQQLKKQE